MRDLRKVISDRQPIIFKLQDGKFNRDLSFEFGMAFSARVSITVDKPQELVVTEGKSFENVLARIIKDEADIL